MMYDRQSQLAGNNVIRKVITSLSLLSPLSPSINNQQNQHEMNAAVVGRHTDD